MQPKAKTLQERMGFRDDELTTPKHDEIMLWLDGNVERLLGVNSKWEPSLVEDLRAQARASASQSRDNAIACMRENRRRKFYALMMESPIDQRDTLRREMDSGVNAVDIQTQEPSEILSIDPPERRVEISKIWEFPILSGAYTVGFIDMKVTISHPSLYSTGYPVKWAQEDRGGSNCFIEVKPKIDSLGEVIRQIRFYQTHCKGEFYICCPDNRFEKQLASQGIGFIKAEV